jgi:hypothetical protein
MARLGRFERPTSGSGDQRSIQLSYRRAVSAHPYFGSAHGAGTAIQNNILSALADLCQRACSSAIFGKNIRVADHPFARDLISFASFSISSAFLSIPRESTWAESVFSTSAFNSLAN